MNNIVPKYYDNFGSFILEALLDQHCNLCNGWVGQDQSVPKVCPPDICVLDSLKQRRAGTLKCENMESIELRCSCNIFEISVKVLDKIKIVLSCSNS